ncbi:DNA-binding helix-turn-helix protein [Leptospira alstonii serovar Pingchang str. 80-412]|uniref:DNA-binding helix-turn-helix protein n=2 Tax=Leptospira alstonii TaxID=28452 RepID=T0G2B6_9LEPT|nr:helix-turn-helix transcriptional regulator [Leptospira alstonii]EQA80382.1 DNA-binding helix-turn-helix protein [Leptospira alstonii serovar Pingchang str. 80-412]
MELKTPGQRVKFIRTEGTGEKITQNQFASEIFISQALLSRIETDDIEVTEQTAFIIEVVYNYKKDWVLKGIGPKMTNVIKFREGLSTKIEEWNRLIRRVEKIPNAKSMIEKYINLTEKDRAPIDLIVTRLSEK